MAGAARRLGCGPMRSPSARAGYLVVTFDYRGWGGSDARLILSGGKPEKKDGKLIAEVKEVRGVVDPIDQTTDIMNAIHWVVGEPRCDAGRIGIWGSSFSGGHVVYVAARDPREGVRQPGRLHGRALGDQQLPDARVYLQSGDRPDARQDRLSRPRSEVRHAHRRTNYREIHRLRAARGHQPLQRLCEAVYYRRERGAIRQQAARDPAHERATGVKKLVIMPGIKHYGIYNEARVKAQNEAIAWFDQHLKR